MEFQCISWNAKDRCENVDSDSDEEDGKTQEKHYTISVFGSSYQI